jgi:hypothetical protein
MSWSLCRWVWRLEAPLFVGMPPSGSLNRCRLYVPARNLWGALTAELAQRRAVSDPDYAGVGNGLQQDVRLTYLFPADETARGWCAWLPRYESDKGLAWQREDDANGNSSASDRELRSRLLLARPGTAIDHDSATAVDGTLRETECLGQYWRCSETGETGELKAVALVGYVFVREGADLTGVLEQVDLLFIGGDSRYGLGRMCRVAWYQTSEVFSAPAELHGHDPSVTTERLLAHASTSEGFVTMRGDLETLRGWDVGTFYAPGGDTVYWKPGSVSDGREAWAIQGSGLWTTRISSQ